MFVYDNEVRPLGIFESLPNDIVDTIYEYRHKTLMEPIFKVINRYVTKPELTKYIDIYMGPSISSYERDKYDDYQIVLPDGMFFIGKKEMGMTNVERNMIDGTLTRCMFIRNTRKQYASSLKKNKKNACKKFECVLKLMNKDILHDDSGSDWSQSDISDGFDELWSSEDEFDERTIML